MKRTHSKLCYRIGVLFLSVALLCISAFPVQADEEMEKLENATSELESELSGLNDELNALSAEISNIVSQIQSTTTRLETTRQELAIAKGEEEAQYEAMALRIQYMYENGNTSILEMLFSSGSLAEFLNHAEYYSSIMEYDRTTLEELTATREQIAANEKQLKEDQEYLETLQVQLSQKEQALGKKISETSASLAESEAELEAAKAEAIRKAEEEARKAAEEAKRAEEEARRAAEEAKKEIVAIVPEKTENNSADNSDSSSNTVSIEATASDAELLAALIECEAGTSNYEGMLAVGSVVVNRMKSSHYPNTLRGVVYQSGQFPPATNGKVDRVLERGINKLCLTAAQAALNGENNVGDCMSFRSASSGHTGTIIGSNVFF